MAWLPFIDTAMEHEGLNPINSLETEKGRGHEITVHEVTVEKADLHLHLPPAGGALLHLSSTIEGNIRNNN